MTNDECRIPEWLLPLVGLAGLAVVALGVRLGGGKVVV